ncbi:pupal cuticle protein 36a-like [Toxorhynchites rutilus septentrionalis]|uniref:pupal cuticle protein 36a-like n=1 Tax=Toxorhynchites rutilus septentrionalis TaxID=329112 RepID=UPI002478694D|nr:pupal cuticle protein 36a-like [Toxorhynchites rutilus septentrionalis]
MIGKVILWCTVVSCVLSARLDNLYGAPAPAAAGRGSGGDSSVLNAPHSGGAPVNQYLPPTAQTGGQGGYASVGPLGGSQGQFGYNAQRQQPQGHGGSQFGASAGQFGAGAGQYSAGGSQFGAGAQYSGSSGGAGGFQQPRTPQIPILKYENVNNGDGSYRFDYATGNGIQHQEEGYNRKIAPELGEQIVSGGYSYTGPDGRQYNVQYKADAGGFQPVGEHLPTPPPQPLEVQEATQLHAKLFAEAASRPIDPAYQGPQTYSQQQPGQQYGAPQPQYQQSFQSQGLPQTANPQFKSATSIARYPSQGQPQTANPQFQSATSIARYPSQGQPQTANPQFHSATAGARYPSAPTTQYLPPTSRQQSYDSQSGYRY